MHVLDSNFLVCQGNRENVTLNQLWVEMLDAIEFPCRGARQRAGTAGERERVRPLVLARTVTASVFAPADKAHLAGELGWLRAAGAPPGRTAGERERVRPPGACSHRCRQRVRTC